MALSDLTRESVLRAMQEYDELGAEEFLARHGYAPAKRYRIAANGRQYDSKAIAGVAHGYATGTALAASEFSGGLETVVKTLEARGFAFAPASTDETRAWLVTTKATYRRLGGSTVYDDDPSSHYSYDSKVANSQQVKAGDRLVFWDEKSLIGASAVASIEQWPGTKILSRCPQCSTTNIAPRKRLTPRFRCDDCHHEFDAPITDEVEVTHYRTNHEQGWVDLADILDGPTLRSFTSYSQNSIRRLDWGQFAAAVDAAAGPTALTPINTAQTQIINGGHTVRQVSVRIGQPAFRAELLRKYGTNCAFSGPAPAEALEACHLYSYAEVGRHDADGGLLLRRDLHRLFDHGLIAVAADGSIDVAESLRAYELYGSLHGKKLTITLSAGQREWLTQHWTEWRKDNASVA